MVPPYSRGRHSPVQGHVVRERDTSMTTPRWMGALLLPCALALAGCTQEQGQDQTVGRRTDGSAVSASASEARRGGDSPANVRTGRDGGADRRQAAGQFQYTLAYPTGERETSVLLLEVDTPQQVRVGRPYNYSVRVTNLTDTPLHGVQVRDAGA